VAVTDIPKNIRDFMPLLQRSILIRILMTHVLIAGLIAFGLIATFTFEPTSPVLWVLVCSVFLLGLLSTISITHRVAHPLRDMLAAVIHIAGEPTTTTPPNPNDKRYERNGFKQALQTIYELGSEKSKSIANDSPVTPSDTRDAVTRALDGTTAGFVVLNHDRTVSYANKAAPVRVDQSGNPSLTLLFNSTNTLDAWLDECEHSAVHAERVWTRIPDQLPEVEGRRFFDVIASYDKGSSNETVLTLVDRTEVYKVSEEELDFIAFAAHELRGPITVIRGYLDVLEDELSGVLADDQHELFRRLTVSANRLSGYINNILNTSRYDRRHLKVHLNEDTLSGIYETIRDDMALRASSQNRLLSVDISPTLPTIAADRASISEVLGNLIDNAIKYSNEGGAINVTAAVHGEFVEISVQDNGIGMPGNVVSQLFQKFYRSHRSRETVAGTGIGLYISKAIVESHGGTISVRSEEGKGSTFIAALPIYATVAAKLQSGDNSNEGLIEHGNGWIKNHSMYRG
jgi:signal transduction histidine kinase